MARKKNNQENFDKMNKVKLTRKETRADRDWAEEADDRRESSYGRKNNSDYKGKQNNQENKYSKDTKFNKEDKNNRYNKADKYNKDNTSKEEVYQGRFEKFPCNCVACQEFRDSNYKETVKKKQQRLVTELEPFTKVAPMITMDKPEFYKNRVLRVFHHEKNGTPMSGHLNGEGRVDKVTQCHIDSKKAQAIVDDIKGMLKSFKIKTHDKRSGYGLLRSVMIREGEVSGEIMVVLVLSSSIMPSKNNFVKAIRKLHPEIDTIIINENYKTAENMLGDKESNIYGKGFIIDEFAGNDFRISSKSLYPVNTVQSKKMYDTVIEWAKLTGSELVLDAYCGSGVTSLMFAKEARKILSVDPRKENVRDAISNIKRNGVKNVDVYKNDPATFVKQVGGEGKQQIDLAIVDQPYMGCGKEFVDELVKLNAKSIIVMAKNPGSLSTELAWMISAGYRVRNAVGIDMLPWTEQVNACVQLIKA